MSPTCILSDSEAELVERAAGDAVGMLNIMRRTLQIQLQLRSMQRVREAVVATQGCQMLVFGMGRDSAYWDALTRRRGGWTVFVEDDPDWIQGWAEVIRVRYPTFRRDWQRDVTIAPDALLEQLGHRVTDTQWDVILIDGPAGYRDTKPGRALSCSAAAALAGPRTHTFLDDCDRPQERAFAAHWWQDVEQITKRFWRLVTPKRIAHG
jgi:hypothetical protein